MACNCGKNRLKAGAKSWLHTDPSGNKKVYQSESEARMAAAKQGGTVRAQG